MGRQQASPVRKLQIGETEALFGFLDQAYAQQPAKRSRELWRRQYGQNPHCTPGSFTTWVCWHGGRIIGQRPMMPIDLQVGERITPAFAAADFFVDPAFQGQGIGSKLMQAVLDAPYIFVTLDSSPGALRIYERLGCIFLGFIPVLVRVEDTFGYLRRRLEHYISSTSLVDKLARLLAVPANAWLRVTRHFRITHTREMGVIRVEPVTNIDVEFDRLWADVSRYYPVIAKRDSATLRWRCECLPSASIPTTLLKAVDFKSGKITGYVVLRHLIQSQQGLIADMLVRPDDDGSIQALLQASIRHFGDLGVETIRCILNQPVIEEHFRRFGFVRRGRGLSFVVHPGKSGVSTKLLSHLDNWFITAVDGDLDPVFRTLPAHVK